MILLMKKRNQGLLFSLTQTTEITVVQRNKCKGLLENTQVSDSYEAVGQGQVAFSHYTDEITLTK